jgi:hypothetical protein
MLENCDTRTEQTSDGIAFREHKTASKMQYCHRFLFEKLRKCKYLQFSESETTAGTDTAVVLDGRAPDNGA